MRCRTAFRLPAAGGAGTSRANRQARTVIGDAVAEAVQAGIPTNRVFVLGFSQGACLASEYKGTIEGTPVFLGCSDVDPHIPEKRVHVTASVFEQLNRAVEERIYAGMGHGVNEDELEYVSSLVADFVGQA